LGILEEATKETCPGQRYETMQTIGSLALCSHYMEVCFFDPCQEELYSMTGTQWLKHGRAPSSRYSKFFFRQGIATGKPIKLLPATTYIKGDKLALSGFASIQDTTTLQHSAFLSFICNSEETCTSKTFFLSDDSLALSKAIQSFEAISVSDGSYHEGYGSATWVLEGSTSTNRITGVIGTPGERDSQSSYVTKLCDFYHIKEGCITVGCDGESALAQAFRQHDISTKDPSHDLLLAIRSLLSKSQLTWETIHIQGHQDDFTPIQELDHWAELNIEMDTAAKKYLPIVKRHIRHYEIPGEPWSVWHKGLKLSAKIEGRKFTL